MRLNKGKSNFKYEYYKLVPEQIHHYHSKHCSDDMNYIKYPEPYPKCIPTRDVENPNEYATVNNETPILKPNVQNILRTDNTRQKAIKYLIENRIQKSYDDKPDYVPVSQFNNTGFQFHKKINYTKKNLH